MLKRFGLTDAADRKASTYSGGMRRRFDIALSLVGNPQIIFLDEPTTELDPESHIEVWQIIKELADRIAIFARGQDYCQRHALGAKKAVPIRKGGVCGETADIRGDIPHNRRQKGGEVNGGDKETLF